jgi:beta-phosphoglucomutase family hydrolase
MTLSKNRAVIWDMDGVIADTAPYHFRAWQEVFSQRKANYTEDSFRRNFGKRNDAIIRNILGSEISLSDMEAIAAEKEASFRKRARNNIKPLPGAIELLQSLSEHGFPQALGSSAPIENIELVTQELGIEGFFQVIVSGREVREGKPSPQGFLLAAERLGVKPQDCVVIEDAMAGVSAAKQAQMHCIAVTNTSPKTKLAEADLVVDTLEKVTVSDLANLLTRPRK